MSFLAFTKDAVKGFLGKFWGGKVRDENGTLKDTGVQEFVEELVARLSAQGPITLDRPIEFLNKTNGPAIKIYNEGPLVDWKGVRVEDANGNYAQLGIGLGSEGINANTFNPHPKHTLQPEAVHQFYSLAGDNANADPDHPKAVEAGNGLTGLPDLLNNTNYVTPFWLNNMLNAWQYRGTNCSPRYEFNHHGDTIYWTTYVPARLELGEAQGDVAHEGSGSFELGDATTVTAQNPFYTEILTGDTVILACVNDAWYVLGAIPRPEYELFLASATTDHARGSKITYTKQAEFGCATSDTDPPETIELVCNLFFGCIEEGDVCLIANPTSGSVGDDPIVIAAPEKLFFSLGITAGSIGKMQHGDVSLDGGGGTVEAFNPFAPVDANSKVAVIRDTSQICGEWVIIAAECEETTSTQAFGVETSQPMPESEPPMDTSMDVSFAETLP
jgi:hypothetical protein